MRKYEVILETTAVLDLYEIFNYITDVLKSPHSAQRVYTSIRNQVLSLDIMPARFPLVKDEIYALMGVRLMPVENYHVFYILDDEKNKVRVFRILYNRREWENLLFVSEN